MKPAAAPATLGPLLALLAGVRVLRHAQRPLPHRRQPVDRAAAGHGRRRDRDRADARHPHRRRRPLLRHGHGARRHRHDEARGELGVPVAVAIAAAASRVTTLFGSSTACSSRGIKLPPFIVTLGTLNIAFAITQLYSERADRHGPARRDERAGRHLPRRRDIGRVRRRRHARAVRARVRSSCGRRPSGRHVYAVGNNPEAARLTGIATPRVLLGVYLLAGVLYGVAALLSVARTGVGDPNAGQTENLDAITAVVLGGTSLFGGRGAVLGSLVGALIVGVFRNGLTLMGVSSRLPDPDHRDPRDSRRGDRPAVAQRRRADDDRNRRDRAGDGGERAREAVRPRDRARRHRLRAARGRDPRRDRRQRRGEVDAHQGAVRRARAGRGGDPARRSRRAFSHARSTRAAPASRPSTRISRSRRRCRSPRICFSGASCAGRESSAACSACWTSSACTRRAPLHMRELKIERRLDDARRWRRCPAGSVRAWRWRAARRSRDTS